MERLFSFWLTLAFFVPLPPIRLLCQLLPPVNGKKWKKRADMFSLLVNFTSSLVFFTSYLSSKPTENPFVFMLFTRFTRFTSLSFFPVAL